MSKMKILSAAFLCLFGAAAACCQAGPGPNAPPNVFNDYKYEFFTLPQGTGTLSVINDFDVVAGAYYPNTPSNTGMYYVRYPEGKIVLLSVANSIAASVYISGLNDRGELLVNYQDKTTNKITGFIRHPNGKTEVLALGGATENTIPTGLNNEGDIFGILNNGQENLGMPFLRYQDGQYLTFSVPDPTDIFTQNINNAGVGLGSYFCPDSEGSVCGFYGKPGGTITTFSYPPNGITTFEINDRGDIAGVAFLAPTGDDYFIRKPDGKIILFGLSKTTGKESSISVTTDVGSINDKDEFIGAYTVSSQATYPPAPYNNTYSYDFIRTPDGKISYYDPPQSPGTLLGNVISNRGVIAGRASVGNGLFLLIPKHCEY